MADLKLPMVQKLIHKIPENLIFGSCEKYKSGSSTWLRVWMLVDPEEKPT